MRTIHPAGTDDRTAYHRAYDQHRGIADELRHTVEYIKFRAWFRAAHPLCASCERMGITKAGQQVHHVRGLDRHPDDLCDEGHCEHLCTRCHAAESAKERKIVLS